MEDWLWHCFGHTLAFMYCTGSSFTAQKLRYISTPSSHPNEFYLVTRIQLLSLEVLRFLLYKQYIKEIWGFNRRGHGLNPDCAYVITRFTVLLYCSFIKAHLLHIFFSPYMFLHIFNLHYLYLKIVKDATWFQLHII